MWLRAAVRSCGSASASCSPDGLLAVVPGCLRKRDSGSMVRLSGQPSGQPWMPGVDLVFGLDVVVEGDMPPGRWELREGDTVIGRGQLEEQ